MATATKRRRVKKGMKFGASYADACPVWEVKRNRGRGVWECEIIDCPDYAGTRKVFDSWEILGAVEMDSLFSGMMDDHASYYASLKPGQIVHYDSGFQQFVRSEAVKVDGKMKLKQIALVGNWNDESLFNRDPSGKIWWDSRADSVREQEVFEPNYSNIYESPAYTKKNVLDPRKADPIVLEVPEQTDGEKAEAKLWRAVEHLQNVIENNCNNDPATILKLVRDQSAALAKELGI